MSNFIHSIIEYQNDEKFITISEKIENRVKNSVDKMSLTDICSKYKNFTSENTNWISEKYKDLVIQERTENLINNKLIEHLT